MSPPPSAPFTYQIAAGAVAGTTELLVMYPLDVVKTRMQLNSAGGSQSISTLGLLKRVIRNEGFATLYRGMGVPMLMEPPKRATKFAANDFWGNVVRKLFGVQKMGTATSVVTGAAAGATEAFVVVPFELVKIRLQDHTQAHKYRGILDCLMKITKEEGPLALYRGTGSTVLRHMVWNAGYFGSIFQIRSLLPVAFTQGQKMRNDILAGSIGGSIGTILNTPLDAVKTRIQGVPRVSGMRPKYMHVIPSLRLIYMEEGFKALYKGLVPKLLRFCPGGGILLVVYTNTLELLMRTQRSKIQ